MQTTSLSSLKFNPPSPPPGFVWRPRLAQSLARGLYGRMMILEAPAGYGKTALLASMAREWGRFSGPTGAKLAWYSLEAADADAAAFLEGVVYSIRRVVPEFGAVTLAALRGTADPRDRIDSLMAVLWEDIGASAGSPIFLVLDDFQWLLDRVVLNALERQMLGPESPLRLIISSRSRLPFYLAGLRSKEQLVELDADRLRFTSEEMRELILQRAGPRIPQGLIDEVARETGGWPAAANLASLLIARNDGRLPFQRLAPTEHGYGLLASGLLNRLPPRYREDVARSSLLHFVDEEGCRDGVGVSDPADVLHLLEVESLPATRFEGGNGTLRYEPLFQSFLQKELSVLLLPQERRDLLRRVASYHAERGDWDHALSCLLDADLDHEAAALVERAAETELALGHLDTVLRWIRTLPSRVRRVHPRLMVVEAELLLARGRVDEARPLLVAARSELDAARDSTGSAQRLGAWTALLLMDGRHEEAREAALDALGQLPEEADADRGELLWLLARSLELKGDLASAHSHAAEGLLRSERAGRLDMALRAMAQLSRLDLHRGCFLESLALSGRAVHRSTLLGLEALYLASLGGGAASAYLEQGRSREAAEVARRSLDAGRQVRDEAAQVRSSLPMALALERLGRTAEAEQRLEEASALAEGLPASWPERTLALQASAASLLRRGMRSEGARKAELALRAATQCSHQPLIDQCHLILAAARMAGPGVLSAVMQLRRLQDVFRKSDSQRWRSASLRLLAQGYARLRIGWAAAWNLQRSLAVGTRESWVGMPLDLPTDESRLLALAVRTGTALEVAATRIGIDRATGREVLGPLLHHKNSTLQARASLASKGMEEDAGRLRVPRLPWPGLPKYVAVDPVPVGFRTLGEFWPLADGQPVEWPSTDAHDLAAYLIVHRSQAVPRNQLLSDLWPGNDEPMASLRLHTALYTLRETLGSGYPEVVLELERRGEYRWDGEGCTVDAELFQHRLDAVRQRLEQEKGPALSDETVSLLESAVKLYGGEYLPECSFDWSEPQREELRLQLLWATRILVNHYMLLQSWREAIGYGLKSLKSDPLQEDMARDLMVCHFQAGDRNAVLRQYREIKRVLARERGVWPSDETRQLRIRLLGK